MIVAVMKVLFVHRGISFLMCQKVGHLIDGHCGLLHYCLYACAHHHVRACVSVRMVLCVCAHARAHVYFGLHVNDSSSSIEKNLTV